MARRFYARFRAAFLIGQKYKRYKLASFVQKIFRLFSNVQTDPDLGKGVYLVSASV